MSKITPYSFSSESTLLPGATQAFNFQITRKARRFQLLSIIWNMRIILSGFAPIQRLNIFNQDIIDYIFYLGSNNELVSLPFNGFTAGPTINYNGGRVYLFEPNKQYFFNEFYSNDICLFGIAMINSDLIETYNINNSVSIEIKDYE